MKNTERKEGRSKRTQSIIRLFLILVILVSANILSGYVFTRFDLTSEHRYSLSPSTKQLAKKLDDVVYFKIYLDGELPPDFKRLKDATRELLDEVRVYAKDNIEYEFIDPSAGTDEKERTKLYKQLSSKGLTPTTIEEKEKGGRSQKILFPGAMVRYRSQEIPMQLLKNKIGSSSQEMLNNSVEGLEYEISSAIRRLTTPVAAHIGFLQGQHELSTGQLSDAARSLSKFYRVDTVQINGKLDALKDFQALIIAKPDSAFDEHDKFIIDQFIMKGGKVLWCIDRMEINIDSLQTSGTNVAIPNELNIDDMLFGYGVRVNTDLIMDLQAAPIPIVTGYTGNMPNQELFPWYYFPLIDPTSKHPIVHNLNAIKCEFVSTLDTVEADSVQKTILLSSSKFSRVQFAPARVSLNILRDEPDPRLYSKRFLPVAVLLEGKFKSNYSHRIPASISQSPEIGFRERSSDTKMIVVSDGDIIGNYVSKKGAVYPLGYDRFTQQTYGNRNFILNCVDYLCGDSGIMELRSKEFKLRLLDKAKLGNITFLSWVNVLTPILLVFLTGILLQFIRRKRYGRAA